MLYITLKVPFALFMLGGFFQRHDMRCTWIQMLHKSFYGATFSRCITTFEQRQDALSTFFHPRLYFQEFDLQQMLFVFVLFQADLLRIGVFPNS